MGKKLNKEIIKENKDNIEININLKDYDIETILKTSYELSDKIYTFFMSQNDSILVKLIKIDKKDNLLDLEKEFLGELKLFKIRKEIEQKTFGLRKKIIETALGYGLNMETIERKIKDIKEHITYLKENQNSTTNQDENNPGIIDQQNDENKSIDDIIKEIESDPDFETDKNEIINILKEIDNEDSKKDNIKDSKKNKKSAKQEITTTKKKFNKKK